MSNVFEGFLSTPEVADAFGDHSFVAAMLRFEAALANAQAAFGVIPQAAAKMGKYMKAKLEKLKKKLELKKKEVFYGKGARATGSDRGGRTIWRGHGEGDNDLRARSSPR